MDRLSVDLPHAASAAAGVRSIERISQEPCAALQMADSSITQAHEPRAGAAITLTDAR